MVRMALYLLTIALRLLEAAIVLRCVFSFLPAQFKENKLSYCLNVVTDPVIEPSRRLVSRLMTGRRMMLDISPLVALFAVFLARSAVSWAAGIGL